MDKKHCQPAHARIVSEFTRKVFTGDLKPGDRLPTEKALQEGMGVDRGALRVALKQLETFGVLDIRQGDGMYVKDYVENAGIDFLRVLFQQDVEDGGLVLDEYIIDEICEFWILLFPGMLELAIKRYTSRDMKVAMDAFRELQECTNDKKRLVELILQSQDLVAKVVNNTVLLLLFNSSRPLRRKLTELMVELFSEEDIKSLIEGEKHLQQTIFGGTPADVEAAIKGLHDLLQHYRRKLGAALHTSLNRDGGRNA